MSADDQHHYLSGPPWRILVVEDETLVAMLVEDMVVELGHQVVGPVERLGQAVAIARGGESVDCAILDINFNGATTYEVADALAARRIPFVFATGYNRGWLSERYRDAPMLQKPFQIGELRRTLAGFRQTAAA